MLGHHVLVCKVGQHRRVDAATEQNGYPSVSFCSSDEDRFAKHVVEFILERKRQPTVIVVHLERATSHSCQDGSRDRTLSL